MDSSSWFYSLLRLVPMGPSWKKRNDSDDEVRQRRTSSPRASGEDDDRHDYDCGSVLFLVDGCNGPIRFDRELFLSSTVDETAATTATNTGISLLHVVNDENCGDRIHLVPALDRFVLATQAIIGRAEIYFDGLGVDQKCKCGDEQKRLAGKEWNLTHRVGLKVTPIHEEADNVIVEIVEKRRQRGRRRQSNDDNSSSSDTNESSDQNMTCTMDVQEACDRILNHQQYHSSEDDGINLHKEAFVFRRNSDGAGRSRQLVRRLGLMRPESVFCVFVGLNTTSSGDDAKTLLRIQHLLNRDVVCHSLEGDLPELFEHRQEQTTIVATDDIFLRQRIVEAGGLVATFEQLWELTASSNLFT